MHDERRAKELKTYDLDEKGEGKDNNDHVFYWKSTSQHLLYYAIYVIDWSIFSSLHFEDGVPLFEYVPTLVHYFFTTLVCGASLIRLHTFIGQFTQNGYFAFGAMFPIAYGIGFIMSLYSFVKLVRHMYYTSFIIYFLFVSAYNRRSPFVTCYESYKNYTVPCFSREDFDLCSTLRDDNTPCFKAETRVLAPVYFLRTLGINLGRPQNEVSELRVPKNKTLRYLSFHGLILYVILLLLTTRKLETLDAAIRIIYYLFCMGMMTLALAGLVNKGAFWGLSTLKDLPLKSFTSLTTWLGALRRTIESMKIAEGGLVIFGSFMRPNETAPNRTWHLTASFALQVFLFSIFFKIFSCLLIYRLDLSMEELKLASEEAVAFLVYPTILALQPYGHLFCFFYFFFSLIVNLCSLMLQVVIIERALASQFNINSYYFYSRVFICTGAFVVMVALFTSIQGDQYYHFVGEIKEVMVVIICIQLIILHMYGVQRFCDDIQFYNHVTVSKFSQACWILLPLYCVIEFFGKDILPHWNTFSRVIDFTITFCFVVPMAIGCIYIVIVFSRNKNLIGILRPMDKFGPKDIEERILRLLYNPRLIEKYAMISTTCEHGCLRNSSALQYAISEEITLIENLIMELEKHQDDDPSQFDYKKIISDLKRHKAIMLSKPK